MFTAFGYGEDELKSVHVLINTWSTYAKKLLERGINLRSQKNVILKWLHAVFAVCDGQYMFPNVQSLRMAKPCRKSCYEVEAERILFLVVTSHTTHKSAQNFGSTGFNFRHHFIRQFNLITALPARLCFYCAVSPPVVMKEVAKKGVLKNCFYCIFSLERI